MKRILYLLASVACVLAGCTVEPAESPLSGSDAPVFRAYYSEDGQTRTTLDEKQLGVLWSAGDAISVFDKENANHKYVASAAGKQCDFALDGSGTVSTPGTWYAIYPYDAKTTFADGSFKVTLPDNYTLTKPGTFADGMNVAVAASETLDLPFRNVLGWIAFAIKGADHVSRVRFIGNADEAISGVFAIDANELGVTSVAPGEKVMVLNIENFQESASRDEAAWYYIPVVPGTFERGFSIIVSKRDGDYTYSYDKSATFKRGEKRELFIEIPGADDKYVDLVGKPLTWPIPQDWGEGATLLPSAHSDIAYAKWVWGENGATYPEGYPTYDINKDMNRFRCVWKGDYFLFNVPVSNIPAGNSLALYLPWRTGKKAPKCWAVEACLDGQNWMPMTLSASIEETVNVTYKEEDETTAVAPLWVPGENKENFIEATLKVTEAVEKQIVKVRIRAISKLEVNGTIYASKPESNSACHVYLFNPKKQGKHPVFTGPTLIVL